MFNTMTMTKLGGAVIGSLLFFLLGNWAASALYHTGGDAPQAYTIEIAAPVAAPVAVELAPVVATIDLAALFAAADKEAGEKVYIKCRACHRLDGKNGVGPHLDGVFGRMTGAVEGYNYSDANKAFGAAWTPQMMFDYLENPKTYMPGNKMTFVGLPKEDERVNLIAYMADFSTDVVFAEAPTAAAAPAADAVAVVEEAAAAAPSFDLDAALAAADLAAGERAFIKCKACHRMDGRNVVGPYLDGVFGRMTGAVEGFNYSEANKAFGAEWTPQMMFDYLENPKTYMPGNKMTFVGLPKEDERVNLIAWMMANGG